MAKGWLHTVYRDGFWVNEVEGGGALTKHETRADALAVGARAAQELGTRHVVHSSGGQVETSVDHGGGRARGEGGRG